MKISILISTKNRIKFLKECLDSIQNQTVKDFEVIICNDGGDYVYLDTNKYDFKIKIINENISKGQSSLLR